MKNLHRVTWPCGMGDALAMSGLAVYLANRHGEFVFPHQPENDRSVREIFAHCGAPVTLMPLKEALQSVAMYSKSIWREDDQEMRIPAYLARTFTYLNTEYKKDSFQQAYEERGVPYVERWASSPVRMAATRVEQIPVPDKPYIFVHDDLERELLITRGIDDVIFGGTLVVRPTFGRTILSYANLIEQAAQIHVIDSTFFHLAEQLDPKGKLFLHRYARYFEAPKHDYLTKHRWEIVM